MPPDSPAAARSGGQDMTPDELSHRLMKFRDHYMRREAIAAGSILDLEFLKIIEDIGRDWE